MNWVLIVLGVWAVLSLVWMVLISREIIDVEEAITTIEREFGEHVNRYRQVEHQVNLLQVTVHALEAKTAHIEPPPKPKYCAECRHCKPVYGENTSQWPFLLPVVGHLCRAKATEEQDPVTGKTVYGNERPCWEVRQEHDGDCPDWEAKQEQCQSPAFVFQSLDPDKM
jgi:hypothetical protein